MNAICNSMNVDGMLVLLGSGGTTSTPHAVNELAWTFCTHWW